MLEHESQKNICTHPHTHKYIHTYKNVPYMAQESNSMNPEQNSFHCQEIIVNFKIYIMLVERYKQKAS